MRLDFYKLAIAHTDVQSALAGFRQIAERNLNFEDPLFQTLVFGAIICYAKPFVGNKMYGKLSSRWEKLPTVPLRRAHDELVELRHKVVAHNDWKDVNVIMIPPGSRLQVEGGESMEFDQMSFAVKSPGIHESRISDYLLLCEHQETAMINELALLKDSLFGEALIPEEPFTLEVDDSV